MFEKKAISSFKKKWKGFECCQRLGSIFRNWKKLKCYQIVGIIFCLLHVFMVMFFSTGHEGGIGIVIMDYPLFILGDKYFSKIVHDYFYSYTLIFGTLLYGSIGMIIGYFINKIKKIGGYKL